MMVNGNHSDSPPMGLMWHKYWGDKRVSLDQQDCKTPARLDGPGFKKASILKLPLGKKACIPELYYDQTKHIAITLW